MAAWDIFIVDNIE